MRWASLLYSMGNPVNMSVYIYLYMCQCMYICEDLYICMNMIVSCMSIHVHIMRLCVLYDYVQCCEDTVSVKFRYIK